MTAKLNIIIDSSAHEDIIEKYHICVQKETGGASSDVVQWYTDLAVAPNIAIFWKEEYQVFFTQTNMSNGAKIVQTAHEPDALLGFSYKFAAGDFTSAGAIDKKDSIRIINGRNAPGYFGLAQKVIKGDGSEEFVPVAVTKILADGGEATFTPTTVVHVYWNQVGLAGMVSENKSNARRVDLKNFTLPVSLTYKSTGWGLPEGSKSNKLTLSPKNFNYWEFILTLEGALSVATILQYIDNHLKTVGIYHVRTLQEGRTDVLGFEVFGENDPHNDLQKIVAKNISSVVRTEIKDGYWDVNGNEARIKSIDRKESTLSLLWASLRQK